jgi:hypothetical protein
MMLLLCSFKTAGHGTGIVPALCARRAKIRRRVPPERFSRLGGDYTSAR